MQVDNSSLQPATFDQTCVKESINPEGEVEANQQSLHLSNITEPKVPAKREDRMRRQDAPNMVSAPPARVGPYRSYESQSYSRRDQTLGRHTRQISHVDDEGVEGVEVVLAANGNAPKIVDSPSRSDQNVFRPPPSSTHRPRAMRPSSSVHSPGSYGYGTSRRGDFPRPPTKVPFTQSGSFEETPYPPGQTHYSPHVHYPTPGRTYPSDEVNVISPNHKPDPHHQEPGTRPRHAHPPRYYQYPPTSPVSRTGMPHSSSPPRKSYGMRKSDGPYSAAQREHSYHPDDGTFNAYSSGSYEHRPPLVAESSFDSEHYASSHQSYYSHPPTPHSHHPESSHLYNNHSWGSFDTDQPPPPHFDDYHYYGYQPDSPYSHYSSHPSYGREPYPRHGPSYGRSHYDEADPILLNDYSQERDGLAAVTPNEKKHESSQEADCGGQAKKSSNGVMLPKAASEVDFELANPPLEPVVLPSDHPICESPAAINSHDVLCGRGGGTNSQIGNRRFRKLVQEFQPTYLLARRKEKPLLARTIVLIIRKRGGRFLKKDDATGELYEVGDAKAEAKTSQALREGLDVRATKSAANSLIDKKKKKKKGKNSEKQREEDEESEIQTEAKENTTNEKQAHRTPPPSPPPSLPRLQQEGKAGIVHPHSPEAMQFRKRRRMRSGGCIPMQDKLFPDFCPPRADLHRSASPHHDDQMDTGKSSSGRSHRRDDDSAFSEQIPQPGCADIAMTIMTGAANGSFCLGPANWRRK